MVKDYAHLLRHDPDYAAKARAISEISRDISEVLLAEETSSLEVRHSGEKVALHCPCSLAHGQQLPNAMENLFDSLGIPTAATAEKHLCCGSAGTYSILQPKLSQALLQRKLGALTVDQPAEIVTANVGCQMHLASRGRSSGAALDRARGSSDDRRSSQQ